MTTSAPQDETFGGVSARARADSSSIGELISDISDELSTLLRQEIALAKAEARQTAQQAGKGAGLLGGAATAGWMVLLFLSVAVWEWLSAGIDNRGWAALIVMAVWAVVAAILAAMGRSTMRSIQGMRRTVETGKRIPDALKGNEETR